MTQHPKRNLPTNNRYPNRPAYAGSLSERAKTTYPHKLEHLKENVCLLKNVLEQLENEIEEVQNTNGGQLHCPNEAAISNYHRTIMKQIGAIHNLQQIGVFNKVFKK